jgi:hypothetical protein
MDKAINSSQAARLTRVHSELTELLLELGLLEPTKAPVDPQWLRDTARQWGLLNAVAELNSGDLGSEQWSRLGRQHGYDPRGLGGFFRGSQPLMATQGERRVLTSHGRRFIDRWRDDFVPSSLA